ncbi:MAG: helix-turn-helix transcriptional regulator [bacterium]|nr:helix-turn-helix transcriptional regulator [bacterium]
MKEDTEQLRGIGARLAQARHKAGLSQTAAAKEIGLARGQSIGDYEQGKFDFQVSRLAELCALYRVSTDWVLGLAETPELRAAGGVINKAAEEAVLRAETLNEVLGAGPDVVSEDGSIAFGYPIPSRFEVVDDEEWTSRRDAVELKFRRLNRGR